MRRPGDDFAREIDAHIAHEADRLMAEGHPAEEAWAEARRRFGNVTRAREDFHERGRARWLDDLGRHLRGAVRQWRRRPAWTLSAIATIAIATGMNMALALVAWNALLRPLPYADDSRLVNLWRWDHKARAGFSPPDRRLADGLTLERWRQRGRSFLSLAHYFVWRATVSGSSVSGAEAERLPAGLVSDGYFETLGVPFAQGRGFRPDEVKPGENRFVVLSHGYWLRRFGGRVEVLNTELVVEGKPCRVIGILAPGPWGLLISAKNPPELYLPISHGTEGSLQATSGWAVGRLRPGVTLEAARKEAAAIAADAAREQSKRVEENDVNITPLREQIGFNLRPALVALGAATLCLLLIACANVGGLLLAQGVERQRELTIREAIGASRATLLRQLMTEALALSAVGVAGGWVLGWMLTGVLVRWYPGTLPRMEEGGVALLAVGCAVLMMLGCALLFGALPAWQAARSTGGLRVGRAVMTTGATRWRAGLAGVQVALTITLLICAGLLLGSFRHLSAIPLGFARQRIVTAQVVLPEARYVKPESRARFAEQLLAKLEAIPGVESTALTNSMPLAFNILLSIDVRVEGRAAPVRVQTRTVSPAYFSTFGLRLLQGRALEPRDANAAVVNEAFAREYLAGRAPVGAQIGRAERPALAIVGVVADMKNLGLTRPAPPEIYIPFAQLPGVYLDIAARTALPVQAWTEAARAGVRQLDAGLALHQVATMESVYDEQVAAPRFHALLVTLFALAAGVLAAVGIYGVVSQGVRARWTELGIRAALGATPGRLFWTVVRGGMAAPLLAVPVGLAGGWAASRLLVSLLFGVAPVDPVVYTAAALAAAGVCLLACCVPGRAAARVDAVRALRED